MQNVAGRKLLHATVYQALNRALIQFMFKYLVTNISFDMIFISYLICLR